MHQATAFRPPGKTDWRPPDFPAGHKTFGPHAPVKMGSGWQANQSRSHAGVHYVHMLSLAAPLIIGELVHDS